MLLALLIAAQAVEASPATLAPFKPFLGSCWRASFSATTTDNHCFEAMYGGAHIRDRHEVKDGGQVVYAGETIYSADGPGLVFTYFNSLGGVGLGKVGSTEGMLGFTGTMRASPDKPEQSIDSQWKIIGPDRYQVQSMVRTKSDELPPALTFIRVKK
jgi:hypothetical protein